MKPANLRLGPHLWWAVALASGLLLFMLLYPLIVRMTLPAPGARTGGSSVAAAPLALPATFQQQVDQAQGLLATPPAGVSNRADLAARLVEKAAAATRVIPVRAQLEQAARLHALNMTQYHFRSDLDQNGMSAGERVAMLDRTGLYAGVDEQLATVDASGDDAADLQAISTAFDTPHALHVLRMQSYNVIGIGCAAREAEVVCVRLVGQLGGELTLAAPAVVAPGTALELQPQSADASYIGSELLDSMGKVLPSEGGGDPHRVQLPRDYRGMSRLRVRFGAAGQPVDYDGPSMVIQQ